MSSEVSRGKIRPREQAARWLVGMLDARLRGPEVPVGAPDSAAWPEIVEQAGYHKLVPHLCHAIETMRGAGPGAAQRLALWARDRENRRLCDLSLDELQRLGEAFRAAGVTWLAFKGVALALQAGLPAHGRESTDVDLYVSHEQLARADAVLRELGYQHRYPAKRDHELRSLSLRHPGTGLDVDLHWAFTARRFFISAPLVLPCRPAMLACAGRELPTLPAEAHLLVVCTNGAKERWRGMARVFDVAALANRSTLDWPRLAALCPAPYRGVLDFGLSLAHEMFASPLPPWLTARDRYAGFSRTVADRELRCARIPGAGFTAGLWRSSRFKWRLSRTAADRGRVVRVAAREFARALRGRALVFARRAGPA